MTLQTQTPGGEPQPIPVKEAIAAVQAAIDSMSAASLAPWYAYGGYLSSRANISGTIYHIDELGQRNSPSPIQAIPFCRHEDAKAIACARAVLPGALEYLLHILEGDLSEGHGLVPVWMSEHRAVAPIVAWHRAQGGK